MRIETLSKEISRLEQEVQMSHQGNKWLVKRGELAQAQYKLFLEIKNKNPSIAIQLLYKSARIGHWQAWKCLWNKMFQSQSSSGEIEQIKSELPAGLLFIYGLQALSGMGRAQSDACALQYFEFAANKNHLDAQHFLGRMYSECRGVDQNKAQAFAWISRSASQGSAAALHDLGSIYEQGFGVTVNAAKANDCRNKSMFKVPPA